MLLLFCYVGRGFAVIVPRGGIGGVVGSIASLLSGIRRSAVLEQLANDRNITAGSGAVQGHHLGWVLGYGCNVRTVLDQEIGGRGLRQVSGKMQGSESVGGVVVHQRR